MIIDKKSTKIGIIGLGYVGLPLAIEFARKGFSVWGIDKDRDRINCLKKKQSYITDISIKDLQGVINKTLRVTLNFTHLEEVDVVIICVPTPLNRKYQPDISYIKSALRDVAKNIKRNTLVILESTTYPGTTEEVILPFFKKRGLQHGSDFYLCFSPERIDPGNKGYPLKKIPKIVGGINRKAASLAKALYENIIEKVIAVSSAKAAEAVKLLENTFRLVNIGLINEIAMMAHKMNIDIWEIVEAARTKPFGFMPFYPGPGVGGHCIPKDPLYLYWKAKKFGFRSRFIRLASNINSCMPYYITERVSALLKRKAGLKKAKILVVGVTYKRDVKDLRKSPALDLIEILKRVGAKVSYYDTFIPYLKINHINLRSIKLSRKRLNSFDCVLISTNHSNIDYNFILKNARLIFDARNVYKGIHDRKVVRL
jgi:UDP-N-acetyl-D-glucosamine dehydrogenase